MVSTYLCSLRRWLVVPVVVASAVLAAGCDDSPTAPASDTTPPPVPTQVSPADGTLFTHFPRSVTLVWNPAADPSTPVTYRIEAQFCSNANPSNCTTRTTWCPGVLTEISCSFDFVGGQPGRWRVKAVDAAGNESEFSPYRTFAFDS